MSTKVETNKINASKDVLAIDPATVIGNKPFVETGIAIRALHPDTGSYGAWDIGQLDRESLKKWLRSRGGENPYAENVVGILLGHKTPLYE